MNTCKTFTRCRLLKGLTLYTFIIYKNREGDAISVVCVYMVYMHIALHSAVVGFYNAAFCASSLGAHLGFK